MRELNVDVKSLKGRSFKHACSRCGQTGHNAHAHQNEPREVPEGGLAYGALNEEQRELATRYRKLVYSTAARIIRSNRNRYADLVQEGMLGLIEAARRFEPERHLQFSTYAVYWIRAMIYNALMRDHGPVRIGTIRDHRTVFFNLGKSLERLRDDSNEAVAADLGVTVDAVALVRTRLGCRGDYSLNADIDGEKGRYSRELAGGTRPDELVEAAHDGEVRRLRLGAAMRRLSARERSIVKWRHLCEEPLTLQEIAGKLDLSRERVRQIEKVALCKVRASLERNPRFQAEVG